MATNQPDKAQQDTIQSRRAAMQEADNEVLRRESVLWHQALKLHEGKFGESPKGEWDTAWLHGCVAGLARRHEAFEAYSRTIGKIFEELITQRDDYRERCHAEFDRAENRDKLVSEASDRARRAKTTALEIVGSLLMDRSANDPLVLGYLQRLEEE